MHLNSDNNPIVGQLKILKKRLDQKGKIIKILSQCIEMQETALISIVQQFESHEQKIMRRLHRLEQINIRYIKDYLEIKKQNKVQDFVSIEHMFVLDSKQFIKHKMQSIKEIQVSHQQSTYAQTKKTVYNCINLMKSYLTERKINYDRTIHYFSQERKRKMKQSKGLQGYRQNKEEGKFIEKLKEKVDRFGKKISQIENNNAIQVFNWRQEIQKDVKRLDPLKGQITLEQSKSEQQMFKSIIEELISYNMMQKQEQYFLAGSFNFIKDKFQALSQTYGLQFIHSSIQSMQKLSPQAKNRITNNRLYQSDPFYKNEKTSNRLNLQYDQSFLGEQKMGKKTNKKMFANQQQQGQQQDILHLQTRRFVKGGRSKQQRGNNKLNDTFQKAKTKTFFQEQQKSRDQLISKQQKQIAEHEKVIDKLINFIKKQFKDLNLDNIDADDPEQLIGYYFKVNEKKYGDIREEMQSMQIVHKQSTKKVNHLTFENNNLTLRVAQLKQQMEELLKKYEKSTFQFHILISSTEDLVKISLQTLINTCMNNISPQQLIAQLEKIIGLIKDNIQKKRNITYKFTVKEEHIQSNQPKEVKQDYIAQSLRENPPFEEILLKYILQQRNQNNEGIVSILQPVQRQQSEHQQYKLPKQTIQNIQVVHRELAEQKQQEKKSQGFDQTFLKSIVRQIQIIKERRVNEEMQDIKEMYAKYKQALDCLERAQHLNRENQIKYQTFMDGLKKKGAWGCPQKLEEKLFYMQKLIAEQDALLQSQRAQYQQTILKQVKQSQILAKNVFKTLKIKKRQTKG